MYAGVDAGVDACVLAIKLCRTAVLMGFRAMQGVPNPGTP